MKNISIKTNNQDTKSNLHTRNKHKNRYDFKALITSTPDLKPYIHVNQYGLETIDFSDYKAVKSLNSALLKHFYGIIWDIPKGYLCPPIPGRADYIHYLADIIAPILKQNANLQVKCLDIGTGANLIYPIIGVMEYNWKFTASDIDLSALQSSAKIIDANPNLKNAIHLIHQKNKKHIFKDVIQNNDCYVFTLCNPPFHSSEIEAKSGNSRKLMNLKISKENNSKLNFGGHANELWTDGGEVKFIQNMIAESLSFKKNCLWFTTLVSKQKNISPILKALNAANPAEIKQIEMSQGQKKSRFIAWTFIDKLERQNWLKKIGATSF